MLKSFFAILYLLCVTFPVAAEINVHHGASPDTEITSHFWVSVPENTQYLKYLEGGLLTITSEDENITRVEVSNAHDGRKMGINVLFDSHNNWLCEWYFTFGAPDYENPNDAANTNETNPFDNVYHVALDINGTESSKRIRFMFRIIDATPSFYFRETDPLPFTTPIVNSLEEYYTIIRLGEYHTFETRENQVEVVDPTVIYSEQAERDYRHKSPIIVLGVQLSELKLGNFLDNHLFELEVRTYPDYYHKPSEIIGIVSFKEPPDYENPQDINRDNVYLLDVAVESREKNHPAQGGGVMSGQSSQIYRIVVTDVADDPAAPPAKRPMKLATSWAKLKRE